jgi:hypothetical protein
MQMVHLGERDSKAPDDAISGTWLPLIFCGRQTECVGYFKEISQTINGQVARGGSDQRTSANTLKF